MSMLQFEMTCGRHTWWANKIINAWCETKCQAARIDHISRAVHCARDKGRFSSSPWACSAGWSRGLKLRTSTPLRPSVQMKFCTTFELAFIYGNLILNWLRTPSPPATLRPAQTLSTLIHLPKAAALAHFFCHCISNVSESHAFVFIALFTA